jgi:arylsulfatase/uncharacterized sulfatase
MIRYLDADPGDERPFFAYLAFQAVHIPVQAPAAYTARYLDRFEEGWDVLRTERWQRAQAMGLVPDGAPLAPMPDGLRPWNSLDESEQALYARSMAVYAGMLEAMDAHLGRLLDRLRERGELDNTIVIVTSDNGPEPSHPVGEPGFTTWMRLHGYTRDIDDLGQRGSYAFIGPEWAMAVASPFNLFKFYATDGGLRVPLIAAGPGIAEGRRWDMPAFVTDILPTVMDLADLELPADLDGISLRATLAGDDENPTPRARTLGVEVSGNAALIDGEFKLVRNGPPFGDGNWRLFNTAEDPGETRDLAPAMPERVNRMLADYADYAERNGVIGMPEDYDIHAQLSRNALMRQLGFYSRPVLAGLFGLAGLVWAVLWFSRRRRRTAPDGAPPR